MIQKNQTIIKKPVTNKKMFANFIKKTLNIFKKSQ
jgi:hypothetical protein